MKQFLRINANNKIVNKCVKIIQYWATTCLPFPCHCLMCLSASERDFALCSQCEERLPWLELSCQICALPIIKEGLCAICQIRPPSFDRLRALFHYAWPVNLFVSRLKYEEKLYYAQILGKLIGMHFSVESPIDCMIPVPLSPKKQQKRGFNQSLELAKFVEREKGIFLDRHSCTKIVESSSQSTLSAKARLKNINANMFKIASDFKAKHVLIIEDVVTTATTINALAMALKSHGVATVEIWSCCRTSVQMPE